MPERGPSAIRIGPSTWGAPWEAIQNARKIMAAGGDWPSELQKAMKYGVPAATTAGVALTPAAGLAAEQQPPSQSPGFDDWWQQLQAQRFCGALGCTQHRPGATAAVEAAIKFLLFFLGVRRPHYPGAVRGYVSKNHWNHSS